ncbi:6-phospho-beta-glucosidase [Virgibacillus natechei]|uniref:6-phospho-beta-glucosidase n=1 Tax=Virgibacillus natechei TaxID=1216297 RepID=A0ABS4IKW5_9BACI|nr:6-phospho-beta-glucosidase [Virgibacillus natechei]MBP1971550.1 6-phospho-beta-glucosidase [Virgibacillus natechei]UZD11980.1 6-phospho-beta-glucosidase [Virgibacillus natechei]
MTRKQLKIAVIGGGSSYTPELIEGFIHRYHELSIRDLFLVDVEEGREKLDIVGALAKRMVEEAGLPIRIHLTMNRKEAIRNADFITTQIRVGLLEARARDERIPLTYKCVGQETTGAGGFAKALRTIPVILDICKEIEELAPKAFLINFTNPAGLVTEAVIKYSNVKSIGLCNLPIGTNMQIAKMTNTDVSNVDIEWVGINHLNWTTKIQVKGKDILEEILNKSPGTEGLNVKNIPDFGWDRDFLRSLGSLPCGYLRYYYMSDKMLNEELDSLETKGTRAEVVMGIEKELFELYKDPVLNHKPKQLEKRGGAYYSLAAVNLITSIYNNKKDIQTVNIENKGILTCLNNDVSVEVNCVIDAEGAHPVQIDKQPEPHIRGLLQVVKAYEELTVEAAFNGDYDIALQALTVHPLVTSVDVAKPILDDILKENRDFLPQFH